MLEQSHELLVLSELFTAIGPERAFARQRLDGTAFWQLLSEPRSDSAALLKYANVPEVIARAEAVSQDVPPLLLVTLPRLTADAQQVHFELGREIESFEAAPVAAWYGRVFEWLRMRFGKRLVVERSGGSLAYVDALNELFAGARFIHIWRDGPECALSMSLHPYFRVLVARLVHRQRFVPVHECLNMSLPLDRYATFWSAAVVRGLAVLERLEDSRVLHIRFEDLTRDAPSSLRRIAGFLDVGAGNWIERASVTVRRIPARVPELPVEARNALERACRPGMRALSRLT